MDEYKTYFLPLDQLQDLLQAVTKAGYQCIGPQVRDGTIQFDVLTHAEQLPWGWRETQSPGHYTLHASDDKQAFAWSNGPQALKPLLFKPKETLFRVERNAAGQLTFSPQESSAPPTAVIGLRACDLAALAIQDQVFLAGKTVDKRYQKRRQQLFVIGVNCNYSSANCFCVSAGTGPEITQHFDVLISELDSGYIMKAGSDKGQQVIATLNLTDAGEADLHMAQQRSQQARDMQTKRIPLDNSAKLHDVLMNQLDHPRWQEVAERCLSCGNCVQVCPTCFCHSEYEEPALDGTHSHHQREWDSCFTRGHSYMTGHIVREETEKRYRQWLTHKVGTWHTQFGSSGCVGCGRCVSWCPVGIDLTEELSAITGESNIRERD